MNPIDAKRPKFLAIAGGGAVEACFETWIKTIRVYKCYMKLN
jgi:hypothetical protein